MPREDRRIIFEPEEVYQSIYTLAAQKDARRLPPGAITEISITESEPPQVVLRLENPAQKFDEKFEYSYDFVAAALMLYCRGQAIPLPKRAQKSLMIIEGRLTLRAMI